MRVDSETGRLRRVLVHDPGLEIDRMMPTMMRHLLFDDILDGDAARNEHRGFRRVLGAAGVEVLGAGRLLAEALETEAARSQALAGLERLEVPGALLERLADLEPAALAAALIQGVRSEPGATGVLRRDFALAPVPNYFFQRDPQVVFGDRVVISEMATAARAREPLLASLLFAHHPALVDHRELIQLAPADLRSRSEGQQFARPVLEGGDVLVAAPDIVLVGVSQRTSRRGAERLAEVLHEAGCGAVHLILVELPPERSFMHLDTVFTFIDRDVCLAYLPVIEGGGPESALVYRVELEGDELTYRRCPPLLDTLAELGLELEVVPCGGGADRIDQEREQWTDGANAFAVAPGVALLYQRNRRTLEELAGRGWRVLSESEALAGETPIVGAGRTVVTFAGHELSRARGGPRCMTMPLEREPLEAA